MTVTISHTADVQAFFKEVAGLGHAEGNPRFKQIILRVLQDTARLVPSCRRGTVAIRRDQPRNAWTCSAVTASARRMCTSSSLRPGTGT